MASGSSATGRSSSELGPPPQETQTPHRAVRGKAKASQSKLLGPTECAPCLTLEELSRFRVLYSIPVDYDLELPLPDDRADNPPVGRICIYEEALKAGVRFPLSPFLVELFYFLGIPFCAVTPNSFRFIIGFMLICFLCEVPASISLFLSFYTLRRHRIFQGWWYVCPQNKVRTLLTGAPSSIKGWKERFFFVSMRSGEDWGLPSGVVDDSLLCAPELSSEERRKFQTLQDYRAPSLKILITEGLLFRAGLSPSSIEPESM